MSVEVAKNVVVNLFYCILCDEFWNTFHLQVQHAFKHGIFNVQKLCAWAKISFFEFYEKVSIWGLIDLNRANINMSIPVRLSPKQSLYDLQKPRYKITLLAPRRKNGRGPP